MSRRIVVFALAAATALMVGPVSADQECFDSTCNVPAATEAPAEPPHASDEVTHAPSEIVRKLAEPPHASIDAIASPEDVTQARAAIDTSTHETVTADAPSKPEPAKDFAKMPPVEVPPPPVVARKAPPEQRIYPKSVPEPAVRHAEQRPLRAPAPVAQDLAAQDEARVVNARGRAAPQPAVEASARVASRDVIVTSGNATVQRRVGGPNIVVVAPPVAEDGTIVGPAVVRPDPNWRLCQIDPRTGKQHYCTTASYHPYGEGGYRPMGTYKAYRTAPGYVTTQPDARIISLDD